MKRFYCDCGFEVYFTNVHCHSCERGLGYVPEHETMAALEPGEEPGVFRALVAAGEQPYRKCANYARENVCNWMVPAEHAGEYCLACEMNEIIPDLSAPDHRLYWSRLEAAKRRALYTLAQLGLPLVPKTRDPARGLAFRFVADSDAESEFQEPLPGARPVRTGHDSGVITINLAESDHVARTRERERFGELYRTLLGHFRHELGHYYWMLLVSESSALEAFRDVFGDERADYGQALAQYHESGPPPSWWTRYISAYSCAHPWEDWAETWAHYMHLADTLDTASGHGIVLEGVVTPGDRDTFDATLDSWIRLSVTMNALNRSMGLRDAYPFVLNDAVRRKLSFVRDVIDGLSAARADEA